LNNAVRGRRGVAGISQGADLHIPPTYPERDRLVPAQNLLSRVRGGEA